MINNPTQNLTQCKRKFNTLIIAFCGILAFAIFILEAPEISDRMRSGLRLCSNVIIPSLFPFMVLSELLIFTRIDRLFERLAGGIFSKIFKLPKCAISAFVLGILCGFPVGTKIAYSLYEKEKISLDDLNHLLVFCNIQSSAFIINTVGISMLSNKSAGVLLYISQVISLIIAGVIYPKFFPKNESKNTGNLLVNDRKNDGIATFFTSSVKSSVLGILTVCGFVLFFYVLCGIVTNFATRIGLSKVFSLSVCSMLEMSCACVEISNSLQVNTAFVAISSVLGFGGISLHFQIMSLCKDAKIKYGRYILFKILNAITSGIFAILLNLIFKIFV